MSSKNPDQLIEKLQELLDKNLFYEYEQSIRTYSLRFISKKNYDDAISFIYKGIMNLLEKDQINSCVSIYEVFLKCFDLKVKEQLRIPDFELNMIFDFIITFPYRKEKFIMINNLFNVFENYKEEKICINIATQAIQNQEFHIAQKYMIYVQDPNLNIKFLENWIKYSIDQEKEFFIMRYVLLFFIQLEKQFQSI